MKTFKRLGVLLLTLVVSLSFVGCTKNEKESKVNGDNKGKEKKVVKIAYLPITHALPLYVEDALIKKDLENIDIELVKFSSWPELIEALNAGKVDGASMLIQLAMKAKEQGIDLKAVALGHKDGNVVVSANDIKKAEDFKGKTFAIPHRLSTHNILLNQMLQDGNVDISDLNIVELPPPEMPAALAEGRIAGYAVAEPFGAGAVVAGKGKALFESEDLWKDSLCCSLVLRNDFIKNNKDAAQELIDGYVKAGEKAHTRDSEIQDVASKYMKVEKDVLDLSLQWITYDDLKINREDYEILRKYLLDLKLSENPPSFEDFVDNSLIENAGK